MLVQSLIVLAITVTQTVFTSFTIILVFSVIARVLWIAKFQGFKVTPVVLTVLEGVGLVVYLLYASFVQSFSIRTFGISLLASIIFVFQVLIEENMYVMVDIRESEREEFEEKLRTKK
jgi:uncharacterized protein YacL